MNCNLILVNHPTQTINMAVSNSSVDGSTPPSLIPKERDFGKKVLVLTGKEKKEKRGILRFIGGTELSEGMWRGILRFIGGTEFSESMWQGILRFIGGTELSEGSTMETLQSQASTEEEGPSRNDGEDERQPR